MISPKFDRKQNFIYFLFLITLGLVLFYYGISDLVKFYTMIVKQYHTVTFNQASVLIAFSGVLSILYSLIPLSAFKKKSFLNKKEMAKLSKPLLLLSFVLILFLYPSLIISDIFSKKHGFDFDKSESSYNLLLETRVYKRLQQ